MSVYCYTDGKERVERWFPMGRAPKCFRRNGRTFRRDYTAEAVGIPASAGWPLTCIASGVNPDQAGELRKFYADHGVPTEVTKDGNPVYRNPAHRKKALKVRGMHDSNSFY